MKFNQEPKLTIVRLTVMEPTLKVNDGWTNLAVDLRLANQGCWHCGLPVAVLIAQCREDQLSEHGNDYNNHADRILPTFTKTSLK